jgi:hypothetical protein
MRPAVETLSDRASKLTITMENPIDTSGSKRSTAEGRRLRYLLGSGGLLLVIMGGLLAW